MSRIPYNKNRLPAAGSPLHSLSPKTIVAIVLIALMGILWLRVLTNGKSGPASAQAAALQNETPVTPATMPLRITSVALPVLEGRNDTLHCDFFSPDNWPDFGQPNDTSRATASLSEEQRLEQQRTQFFDKLPQKLNLDAIFHAGDSLPARVCIDGKILTLGQSLTVKHDTENYELTVSEIGENQVVLTWKHWSVVMKMAQPERVD